MSECRYPFYRTGGFQEPEYSDMLIAAHAKAEGIPLVTNNVKEFARVPGLEIENWAE